MPRTAKKTAEPETETTATDETAEACRYCGRDATGRRDNGAPVCDRHTTRFETRGEEISAL